MGAADRAAAAAPDAALSDSPTVLELNSDAAPGNPDEEGSPLLEGTAASLPINTILNLLLAC
jgi:hypothetical protein